MEDGGATLNAERGCRINLVILAGELQGATMSDYHRKALLVDVIYAEPQAATHLQRASATIDNIAATTSEKLKSVYYTHPGHVS